MKGARVTGLAAGRSAIAWLFADGRLRGVLSGAVILVILGWSYMNGFVAPFDRALLEAQYRLLSHDASDDLTVVDIDAQSLRQLNTWPWPRTLFADAIDRLTEAGAQTIVFDIDFSARSAEADDARFAEAIARADGRVVLPVFQQKAAAGPGERRLVSTAPLEAFQRNARLATVTIQPAADGRIWWWRTADLWNGWRLPTTVGLLASADRQHGQFPGDTFLIDYSIRPASITHLSFVDLVEGRFDPRLIVGRKVLIGATAVELGDHFTVPIHTELPGVVIQALAYETLMHGTAAYPASPLWTLLATVLFAALAGYLFSRLTWSTGALVALAAALAVFAAATALRLAVGIAIDAATPILAIGLIYLIDTLRALDIQTLSLFKYQAEIVERRALMQSVVESSFDGIIIANVDGAIRILNPVAARMLGCASDAAIGRNLAELIAVNSAGGEDPLGIAGAAPFDVVLATPGVSPMSAQITVCRVVIDGIFDGYKRPGSARPLYIYTIRDVTTYVAATQAERRAREEAVMNSRTKTEFLANMSHELRTPLNAILGFSDILRAPLWLLEAKKSAEYAENIHQAGTHLLAIINDILDVSRIELGKHDLNEELIEIPKIVNAVVRMIAERTAAKRIELQLAIASNLPPLWADERALKQMLLNLLNNAVKFTDAGGRVTLEVQVENDGALTIIITDTGVGIASKDLARVSQPFFQADSSNERRYEGAGLGLAIVKGLVELHGGEMEIESALGIGTRVALRFPPERVSQRLATVA